MCDWTKFKEDRDHFKNLGDANIIIPPFSLLAIDDDPEKELLRAKNYTEMKCPNKSPHEKKLPPKIKPNKIKIGYFSADFVNHATMHLMKKLFKIHNNSEFEIHAFSYDMYGEDDTKKDFKKEVKISRELLGGTARSSRAVFQNPMTRGSFIHTAGNGP